MLTLQPVEMKLIHTMAHALRHDPAKYGLEPDPEGWVSFDDLIIAIRFERNDWLDLTRCHVKRLLNAMESENPSRLRPQHQPRKAATDPESARCALSWNFRR